jgi:sterol desaturase/sphingolipid hydroxylase (fatty acid hydroxylase superfamily)
MFDFGVTSRLATTSFSETMYKRLLGLTIAFVALTLIFWVVEFFWPGVRAQRKLRRGFLTDTLYWFFTPLVTKSVSQVAVLVALAPTMLLLGRSLDRATIAAGHGPVLALPKWLQAVVILVVGDFIAYWTHRWFHGRCLWRFHAVHHSSQELDWLSSVRLHPVNELVSRLCQAVPFVALGFSPLVLAAYVPFLTFYSILIHANVSWSFGPLRYLAATPEFHRWHHTSEEEGLDKNFAGLLPMWDIAFGTFYMPRDKHPTQFGIRGDPVPDNFWGQMMYPFRRRRRAGNTVAV